MRALVEDDAYVGVVVGFRVLALFKYHDFCKSTRRRYAMKVLHVLRHAIMAKTCHQLARHINVYLLCKSAWILHNSIRIGCIQLLGTICFSSILRWSINARTIFVQCTVYARQQRDQYQPTSRRQHTIPPLTGVAFYVASSSSHSHLLYVRARPVIGCGMIRSPGRRTDVIPNWIITCN